MLSNSTSVLVRRLLLRPVVVAGVIVLAAPGDAQQGWIPAPRPRADADGERNPGWRKPADAAQEMDLQAAEDGLDKVEAGYEVVQEARFRVEPVTDLLVKLRHAVQRHRNPAATDHPSEGERSFIEAQLLVVTRGRINPAGLAQCSRFDGDVLVCTIECDGGEFGLRRGRRTGEHYLLLGASDAGPQAAAGVSGKPGFRLGSCATRGAPGLMLMPRAGRLATEVRLTEQR